MTQRWIAGREEDGVHLSVITVSELLHGRAPRGGPAPSHPSFGLGRIRSRSVPGTADRTCRRHARTRSCGRDWPRPARRSVRTTSGLPRPRFHAGSRWPRRTARSSRACPVSWSRTGSRRGGAGGEVRGLTRMDAAGSDGQGEDEDDVSSGACSRRAPHASERSCAMSVLRETPSTSARAASQACSERGMRRRN